MRYAVADPHPAPAVRRVLRAAGVDVAGGVLAEEVASGPLRGVAAPERTGRRM